MIKDEWIKSSRSNGNGGNNCVEVLATSNAEIVFVRNSKTPTAGLTQFSRAEWQAFIDGAKAGEFDL